MKNNAVLTIECSSKYIKIDFMHSLLFILKFYLKKIESFGERNGDISRYIKIHRIFNLNIAS